MKINCAIYEKLLHEIRNTDVHGNVLESPKLAFNLHSSDNCTLIEFFQQQFLECLRNIVDFFFSIWYVDQLADCKTCQRFHFIQHGCILSSFEFYRINYEIGNQVKSQLFAPLYFIVCFNKAAFLIFKQQPKDNFNATRNIKTVQFLSQQFLIT